jgi:protein-disulfide isomerase
MTTNKLIIAAAVLALAACNKDKEAPVGEKGPDVTAAPVPPPANGDWSTVVKATPEGGFVMGNPNAKVKLVEYGSMTCPHCAEFEEKGAGPLIDNYVKKGWVSYEFRNFVRDAVDITASVVARCNGESTFFALTRGMYADQRNWMEKLQAAPEAQAKSLETMSALQRTSTIADMAGFKTWAAQRGVPRAKLDQCLANQGELDKLVQVNADAVSQYSIPGTPTFLINGSVVDKAATWEALEPKIKEAIAS